MSLGNLPLEILWNILEYLHVPYILKCRVINKEWNTFLSENNMFWKAIFQRDKPELVYHSVKELHEGSQNVKLKYLGIIKQSYKLYNPSSELFFKRIEKWSELQLGVLGSEDVGKTSVIFYYNKGYCFDPSKMINGISGNGTVKQIKRRYSDNVYTNYLRVYNRKYKIVLHDDYNKFVHMDLKLRTQKIRSKDGFLLIYAVNDRKSFEDISVLFDEISMLKRGKCSIVLIGNKSDSEGENAREVTYQEGRELAEKLKITFFETSTKNGKNVRKCMKTLCKEMLERKKETDKWRRSIYLGPRERKRARNRRRKTMFSKKVNRFSLKKRVQRRKDSCKTQ